jgi:pSer/pThr/pTyr-binding forkhead associated (FHA) protein
VADLVIASFLIGRGDDCDVRVQDEYANKHHARVHVLFDGSAYVEDLGATNPIYVVRGTQRWKVRMNSAISPGDVLLIGRTPITWNGVPQ